MIKNILLTIAFLLIAFLAFANTHGFGNLGDPALVDSATDDELINKFKAEANTASFTAYPVYFTQGKPLQNVGDVIGLFMEQGGMENVVPGKDTFLRKDGSDLEQIADDFASFIKSRKGVSDYSLYSEMLGSQKSGVSEIRFVLVNSEGKLVWKYRSVKGSSDFKSTTPQIP